MTGWDELKSSVIDKNNCCLCGTCIGICPVSRIIASDEKITCNEIKCIHCGKCIAVCPGNGFDYYTENKKLFHADSLGVHNEFGYYKRIIKGYANNARIRDKASSGGALTALSCYLLDNREVDYVVGVVNNGSDCRVEAIRTTEEAICAAQSKYVFLPVNSILQYIRKNHGRYMFVGLPCQIEGMRNAAKTDPLIAERIVIYAGLFCGFNLSALATDYLIKKSGIDEDSILSVEYRAKENGKTGFKITSNKKEFFISKHGYTILNAVYSRERCWKCYDFTAEFADISFGDAWEEKNGYSRIIVRSEKAEQFVKELCETGYISIFPSGEEDIYNTQERIVNFKKKDIIVRKELLKDFPVNNVEYQQIGFIRCVKAALFLYLLKFGQTEFCRKLLEILPIQMIEKLSINLRSGSLAEFFRYLFWGIMTTAVNLICFWGLQKVGLNYRISNLLTILFTKAAAFVFNKFFVFKTSLKSKKNFLGELIRFALTRGATGVLDYFGLIFLVDHLFVNRYIGKTFMLIIVTLLNYFLGKFIVYKEADFYKE